jgi:hypothetical protein
MEHQLCLPRTLQGDELLKSCKRLLDFRYHNDFKSAIEAARKGMHEGLCIVMAQGGSHTDKRLVVDDTSEHVILSPSLPKRRRGSEKRRLKPGFERDHKSHKRAKCKTRKKSMSSIDTTPAVCISSSDEESEVKELTSKRKIIPRVFSDVWDISRK